MSFTLRSLRLPLFRATSPRPAPLPSKLVARAFSSSFLSRADHGNGGPPQLYGPGGKAGEVPTDEEQATGLERFELLGDLMGVDVFDMKPLQMDRMGTMASPIPIFSLWPDRIVGCTGFPADSHDTIWMRLEHKLSNARCPECGCVYKLDFKGDPALLEEGGEHHH